MMLLLICFLFLIVISGPIIFVVDKYYVKKLPENHSFRVFWEKYVVVEYKEDEEV
jgi:hypothetical protein